nr:uncharacterized protein LOC748236 [Pan troglodytes]
MAARLPPALPSVLPQGHVLLRAGFTCAVWPDGPASRSSAHPAAMGHPSPDLFPQGHCGPPSCPRGISASLSQVHTWGAAKDFCRKIHSRGQQLEAQMETE